MSEPIITSQSGASSSNQSRLFRLLQRQVLKRRLNHKVQVKRREQAERQRIKEGREHHVHVFYQVDDPYSHLLMQALKGMQDNTSIRFSGYLTQGVSGNNNPEPELLTQLARTDAAFIAPGYGLHFDVGDYVPSDHAIKNASVQASKLLSAKALPIEALIALGNALWSGVLEDTTSDAQAWLAAEAAIDRGSKYQQALGHYGGAMLHYEGEWYWGVDRLYHLEQRLQALGVHDKVLFPRPSTAPQKTLSEGFQLECYPSLRSPYSAICFDAVCQLADAAGLELILKPVLPMVMRGVTLTRAKGAYIMSDCAREARTLGKTNFGNFYDPIGDGVIRGFSIYPLAIEKGLEREYLKSFMDGAFCEGINSLSNRGLKKICERAGLQWKEAKTYLDKPGWGDALEQNRQDMYSWGSWGVPSFRLISPEGQVIAQAWGQDRLWRFAQIIDRIENA